MAAKRRKHRVRLGDTAATHTAKEKDALSQTESHIENANRMLNNGLCRQAVDSALAAERNAGEAYAHRRARKDRTDRLNAQRVFNMIGRLRLRVLETCTRDD